MIPHPSQSHCRGRRRADRHQMSPGARGGSRRPRFGSVAGPSWPVDCDSNVFPSLQGAQQTAQTRGPAPGRGAAVDSQAESPERRRLYLAVTRPAHQHARTSPTRSSHDRHLVAVPKCPNHPLASPPRRDEVLIALDSPSPRPEPDQQPEQGTEQRSQENRHPFSSASRSLARSSEESACKARSNI
jgi:hypothetical protein